MVFILNRPKTVDRKLPHVVPDADKLLRCVADSLEKAEVIKNDSQIVDIVVYKKICR